MNLPALTGSPKQIEWADKIRAGFVAGFGAALAHPHYGPVIGAQLAAKTAAAWWIDNRDMSPSYIGRTLLRDGGVAINL